jgi:hypothetical protein
MTMEVCGCSAPVGVRTAMLGMTVLKNRVELLHCWEQIDG